MGQVCRNLTSSYMFHVSKLVGVDCNDILRFSFFIFQTRQAKGAGSLLGYNTVKYNLDFLCKVLAVLTELTILLLLLQWCVPFRKAEVGFCNLN